MVASSRTISKPLSWEIRPSTIARLPDAYICKEGGYAILPRLAGRGWELFKVDADGSWSLMGSFATDDGARDWAGSLAAGQVTTAVVEFNQEELPANDAAWPTWGMLKAAIGIAIAGAAASALISVWFAIVLSPFPVVSSIAGFFFLFNGALAAVNVVLLRKMAVRSRRAWIVALVLVALGALFDVVGQATGIGAIVDLGAMGLASMIGIPNTDVSFAITTNWLVVHLFLIELPILALLLMGAPSNREHVMPPGQGPNRSQSELDSETQPRAANVEHRAGPVVNHPY